MEGGHQTQQQKQQQQQVLLQQDMPERSLHIALHRACVLRCLQEMIMICQFRPNAIRSYQRHRVSLTEWREVRLLELPARTRFQDSL